MTIQEYISGLAGRYTDAPLTEKQMNYIVDYVKKDLQSGGGLVSEAVDALEEHKVEFELDVDWDSLEDEDAIDRYAVYEGISDEVFTSNEKSGYIEVETGETINWSLDVTKDGYDIDLGRLRWETSRDIADLIYERNDYGVLYDFEDVIEYSIESCDNYEMYRFIDKEAENWTHESLPSEAVEFVYAYVTTELEKGDLIKEAVDEMQKHQELAKDRKTGRRM